MVHTVQAARVQASESLQSGSAQTVQCAAQTETTQVDADFASELIASGLTTQPVETVMAVLTASRDGASINAAAKASGINFRTAQRIVDAAAERRQRQLAVVG
jgi:response regulator of citrate/malate metabolism